jgi:hypothetical protein
MFLLALRTTFRHFQRLTHIHNTCIAKYVDGIVMDGWWIQGKLLKGLLIGADHSEYHGEFEDGKFDGNGFFKYPDGSSYLGKWEVYRAGWRQCRGTERQVDRRQRESVGDKSLRGVGMSKVQAILGSCMWEAPQTHSLPLARKSTSPRG